MARYTGPVCRICRREGEALFLKGSRCYSEKCGYRRRSNIPGQHGAGKMRRNKQTGYEVQLRAKQKVRKTYGLLESQFRKYCHAATRQAGNTGVNLLHQLEKRLDNVIYRMGFGFSRSQARMWVTQGHFCVNNKSVNIPSYQLKPGDVISIKETSKIKKQLKDILEQTSSRDLSPWLEVNSEGLTGKFVTLPERTQLDPNIQESLIVEFYSR